jgi:hypothetical protein
MDKFKLFLLNEDKAYLGHKVGDLLTSMQDLQDDMENVGSRHLNRLAEEVVNQIRKILHDQWEQRNHKYLKELQKIGVAIQKTIEDKGDLKEMLPSAVQALQDLSGKLGVKVNNLEAPEMETGEPINQDDFENTGDGPPQEMPQDLMQQMPPQDPMQQMPPQDPMQQMPQF